MHPSIKMLIEEKQQQIIKLQEEIFRLENMSDDILNLHLDAFSDELGKRITNHLRHMTVGELVTKNEAELSKTPLIGKLAVEKVQKWLKKNGLNLSSK